jgi:hypothetical protein
MKLLLTLALLAITTPAIAADLFIEAGVGQSIFQRTTPDGVWWQSPFPHHFELNSLALKAGLGVQLNEHWSVTASYVSLGTVKAFTEAVSDHNFDYGDRKDPRVHLTTYDSYQGGQVLGQYRWTQWPVQPFLQGGVAVMSHHIRVYHSLGSGTPTEFTGVIPMVVVGGGLCWQWVCGEVSYYRGVQAPQYPISTQAIVPMLSVRYGF